MTRKDYVLIAKSFAITLQSMDAMAYDKENYGRFGVETAARGLAITLSFDNPRFDAERFLEAAGVTACKVCGKRGDYHSKFSHDEA